jgi:two-component system, NtrC family, response regulator AtoC
MRSTKTLAVLNPWEGKSPFGAGLDARDVEHVGDGIFFLAIGAEMCRIRAQAEMLAHANVPVLILGERGTEKEAVARLVHKLCFGTTEGFRKISCSSPHALEGGLFSREPTIGSSSRDTAGSEQGTKETGRTFFFDELVALATAQQATLMQELRQLQRQPGRSYGSRRPIRILAAGEPTIQRAVRTGRLREDLYEWVSTLTVRIPPLCQRPDEIEALLEFTMERLAQRCRVAARPLPPRVVEACRRYSWPGNVRELEDFVRRYLLFGEPDVHSGSEGLDADTERGTIQSLPVPDRGLQVAEQGPERNSFLRSIRWETERKAIAAALEKTGWNRRAAAQLLKVSYRSLLYKISQYKIIRPETSTHSSL